MNSSSAPKKRGLGRGLGALITDTQLAASRGEEFTSHSEGGGVRLIAIDRIRPNPQQPRVRFDQETLNELAVSIRAHGIIQPLIVTQCRDEPGAYWLVAGERRWRAAQIAGLSDVPAILRDASSQQLVEIALVENVQRADLGPLEEATAYHALMDEFGLTQAEIAQRVGKSRSAVANTLRLLQLPDAVQVALTDGLISAGHARALLSLPSPSDMDSALNWVLTHDLNVRQTEALVGQMTTQAAVRPEDATKDAAEDAQTQTHLAHLEDRFRNALGTRVSLNRNRDGSGRLVIHFYSDEDLENLYRAIAGDSPLT